MTHSSYYWFTSAALLCFFSACEIEIPDDVFRCSEDNDCPGGWVCDDGNHCREHGQKASPDKPHAGNGGRGGAGGGGRGGADAVAGGDPDPGPSCSPSSCGEHAHCSDDDAGTPCACDDGYARDDGGVCRNVDDCSPGACSPGGRCVDGINDYSCVCDKGYEGSGSKTCSDKDDCKPNPCGAFTSDCVDGLNSYTCSCLPGYTNTDPSTCSNINECKETNACSLSPTYPCRDADPFYYCAGQFLSTPMPDRTIGAAKGPLYTADAETLLDNVTGLRWQRDLPAIYPKCTGKATTVGDVCKWIEARDYCEELVLDGFTEWRLPHKIELESLLDLTRVGTANPTQLPELPATLPFIFWTDSAYSLQANRYWYTHFGDGWSYFGHEEFEPARVRCVR